MFGTGELRGHERVWFVNDGAAGPRAVIAVHDTTLGPGGGGVRFHPYPDSGEALRDVLRLSRTMTYKLALAGLPFGGAKAVIIGDPRADGTEALLEAFGRAVEDLRGLYTCGPDAGTTPDDMAVIARATRHVVGLPGGAGGDIERATGYGVYHAVRAAVRRRLGRDDLAGLRVAVQGLGKVGLRLCRQLAKAGARLHVADLDPAAVARAVEAFGATAVPAERVLGLEVDVLAPCAMGGVLDGRSVRRVCAPVVCGGANDQLADPPRHGRALADRGVLFVPDYVANAGGSIAAAAALRGEGEADWRPRVRAIYDTCQRVFDLAEREAIPTHEAADRLAEEVLQRAKRARPEEEGPAAGRGRRVA
ncbi:MAG TPA: Glu/Leu/Phe/Val dehydrogenase dimerization domain-containing protein [Geminicoccaceae bacterium]|nr:Glu/Leu/Phe/Val dehydrogenase dimerization domain-containing protein [Geminicoccaceae bacterium]